jgi:precorrin-6Y C5,15-methyltransferase (decarboxylating)
LSIEHRQDKNKGANKLCVVSLGPGSGECLTPAAGRALRTADCLFVTERHVPLTEGHGNVVVMDGLEDALERMEAELERGSVAVAVSGDGGIFSLLPRLRKRFPDREISVVPGVSSLQSLCAALGETWDDAEITSVHGRAVSPSKIAGLVAHNEKTVFFCGPDRHPAWICRLLSERGLDVKVAVGERLSYPDERVTRGRPAELTQRIFDPLSLVWVRNPEPLPLFSNRPEDVEFLRSQAPDVKVPMTCEEVRTIILDRLRPSPDSILWDIGAGTGSVAVACARLCPFGEVHALERLPEAVDLLRANKAKFRSYNLFIHEGSAPEALANLPSPTHVFIGGSGGGLRQILEHVQGRGEGIRVVVSGVTLGTICAAFEALEGPGFRHRDAVQISVSRGKPLGGKLLGGSLLGGNVVMTAQNPVTLLSAWTAGKAKKMEEGGKGSASS